MLRLREPDWFQHRLLKGPATDLNLHLFSAGCPETDRMLLFRNRLRSHADDRELYEGVKRELAGRDWTSVQQYADAKTAVIRAILARAGHRRTVVDGAGDPWPWAFTRRPGMLVRWTRRSRPASHGTPRDGRLGHGVPTGGAEATHGPGVP